MEEIGTKSGLVLLNQIRLAMLYGRIGNKDRQLKHGIVGISLLGLKDARQLNRLRMGLKQVR